MKNMMYLSSLALVVVLIGSPSAMAQEQQQTEPATQEPSAETMEPSVQASYERGLRLYRNRGFREALGAFTEVAQMEPDRADVLYLMGYCHLMLKEYSQSLEAFERSIEADPQFDPRTIYKKK